MTMHFHTQVQTFVVLASWIVSMMYLGEGLVFDGLLLAAIAFVGGSDG